MRFHARPTPLVLREPRDEREETFSAFAASRRSCRNASMIIPFALPGGDSASPEPEGTGLHLAGRSTRLVVEKHPPQAVQGQVAAAHDDGDFLSPNTVTQLDGGGGGGGARLLGDDVRRTEKANDGVVHFVV